MPRRCQSPPSPKTVLVISPRPASVPTTLAASIGTTTTFWLGAAARPLSASTYFSATRKFAAARSPWAMAALTSAVALASASARRSRASASRKAASLRPSAARICACFSPSARRICAWRSPSASRMLARFSRSAFICLAMASARSAGGRMSLISMRVTLTPQGEAAASMTRNSRSLISSRCDRSWSRSIEPTTVRMLVIVSVSSACDRSATS